VSRLKFGFFSCTVRSWGTTSKLVIAFYENDIRSWLHDSISSILSCSTMKDQLQTKKNSLPGEKVIEASSRTE